MADESYLQIINNTYCPRGICKPKFPDFCSVSKWKHPNMCTLKDRQFVSSDIDITESTMHNHDRENYRYNAPS